MVIQHNMQAMNTNRQLGISVGAAAKSTEKLSSGYRINRAGDDAAGLAISEKMRSQIRGLDRASANSQDGISLIQTAEGALNETQSILQRMRELAVQAANGTNTDSDRNEIQKEVNQLTSEINRIANTTEFNTMKLLKGNDMKGEIDSVDTETLKDGAAGKLAGLLDNFNVETNSQIGKESTSILKGTTTEATGKIKEAELDSVKEGKVGTASKTTVGGVEFKAIDMSSGTGATATGTEGLNKLKVKIVSIEDKIDDGAGNLIDSTEGLLKDTDADGDTLYIAIKQSRLDSFDSAADLKGFLKTIPSSAANSNAVADSLKAASVTLATAGTGAASLNALGIEVGLPDDEATGDSAFDKLPKAVGQSREGIMQGGQKQTAGEYKFTISTAFKEADDVIVVAGERFTAKAGGTIDADSGEFDILNGAAMGTEITQAASLVAAMKKNANLKDKFDIVDNADGSISLYEKATTGGAGLSIDKNIQVLGGGENSSITITNPGGTNDDVRFNIKSDPNANDDNVKVAVSTNSPAAGAAPYGIDIEITLGKTANGNKASKIQQAIRDLGVKEIEYKDKDGTVQKKKVDFTKFTVEANGNWDKETTNLSNITKDKSALGGGVEEKNGEYSFDIASAFAEGDQATILGKTFTAKKGNADVNKGEFDVTSNSKSTQAANLAAALNQDKDIVAKYSVKAQGSKLIITENEVTGKDIDKDSIGVQAIGTTGQYKVDLSKVLQDGATLKIDDQEIEVSSKNAHVGYENGTAIKVADSVENQNKAVIDAINKNAELSKKYEASIANDGKLMLTQKIGSENAPEVTTIGSDKGTFDVTFQVGANTGQSMTIAIGDNRANALGVAGDGSTDSIMADNGATAYYTKTENVTDGTTNDNIEFALDITSFEKATAAIGVIDDALSSISAQRSQLGAYQNRLEHTIANLDNTSENLQSSESRIRDVDMAKEMTNFSKNNILQQAAQSMLAQANQSTQGVLTLLR